MNEGISSAAVVSGVHIIVQVALIVRVLLRPHREAASRIAWIVGAASRSYYEDLIAAGVHVYEYVGGLLHTKSLTIDGEVTLIGSANMDRRSFELNYENNILFCDVSLTATMIQRQESYIAKSRRISSEMVAGWTWRQRLWNNTIAMIGPVL
jgi:cardiolipin synthase